jgi:hypothetical protein
MSRVAEALRKALAAMEQAAHWQATGQGRPPAQTLMFEIEEARAALAEHDAQLVREPVAYPAALRVALENLDSLERIGPTTEAVIDAAQKWYLATPAAPAPDRALTDERPQWRDGVR